MARGFTRLSSLGTRPLFSFNLVQIRIRALGQGSRMSQFPSSLSTGTTGPAEPACFGAYSATGELNQCG